MQNIMSDDVLDGSNSSEGSHCGNSPESTNEYLKTTDKLLEYVGFLEAELENLKSETEVTEAHHNTETKKLKDQLLLALRKANEAERDFDAHEGTRDETQPNIKRLNEECRKIKALLKQEHDKEKVLESRIKDLERELEKKNDLIIYRKKRDSKAWKQIKTENEYLRKKATLSWMLGCLSDLYLQLEPSGRTNALLKTVRKIQRELERENIVSDFSSTSQMMLECNNVENEIHRLIECTQSPTNRFNRCFESSFKPRFARKSIEATYIEEIGKSAHDDGEMKYELKGKSKLPSQRELQGGVEDTRLPRTRFVVKCFDTQESRKRNKHTATLSEIDSPQQPLSPQLEKSEANSCMDVIDSAQCKSPNPWEEPALASEGDSEHLKTDIKQMLNNIKASMDYLLEQERHRSWKESQLKHLGYYPTQKIPPSALWKRKPWQ